MNYNPLHIVPRTWRVTTMLIAGLFLFTACPDDPIDTPEKLIIPEYDVTGSWYCANTNRELRFEESSGYIYLTYADVRGADTRRGNYTLNYSSKTIARLSEKGLWSTTDSTYHTLAWSDENSFSLSSANGTSTYRRVKETLNMKAGESTRSDNITQYDKCTVIDKQLLSIERGSIISSGSKGYTYIEVNDGKTVFYVKVRVGVDEYFYDLWYDYSSILGRAEKEVKSFMGGDPSDYSGGYWLYKLTKDDSPVISDVCFYSWNDKVIEFYVNVAEGVSMSTAENYIKSKYYLIGTTEDGYKAYADKAEDFDFYLVVVTDQRRIFYEQPSYALWEDMTQYFGYSKQKVKTMFASYTLAYEEERVLEYHITNSSSNISAVAMWFDGKGVLLNQLLVAYKASLTEADVDAFLCQDYKFNREGTNTNTNSKYRLYYNDERTIEVLFYPTERYVFYSDLTQELEPEEPENPEEPDNSGFLPNFLEGLDKTQSQVQSLFGTPYSGDETRLNYADVNNVIDRAIFFFNSAGLCYEVLTRHVESVTSNTIVDFLNSKYYPYEGMDNVWLITPSFNDATAAVFYYPDNRMIEYVSLINKADSEAKRKLVQSHKCPIWDSKSWFDENKITPDLKKWKIAQFAIK